MRRTATTGLAVLVLYVLVSDVRAQPFPPDVTPAEFKCIIKCYKKFWAGQVPETDCLPPYAGDTLVCVGAERGAEASLRNAILTHGSPPMDACLEGYREWSVGRIETECASGTAPDGCPGEYPSGDVWAFLTTFGMVPYFGSGTFCAE